MLGESAEKEETPEDVKERIERLSTLEGQEELRRRASELLAREQNLEHKTLPAPSPRGPVTYEVKIRGDGGGVEIKQ
jgi:hypothetical protein